MTIGCGIPESADPFVVNKFVDEAEKLYISENLTSGDLVHNCDETAFTHDPNDVRVVAEKEKLIVSKNILFDLERNI
jgi:hypothetical protein